MMDTWGVDYPTFFQEVNGTLQSLGHLEALLDGTLPPSWTIAQGPQDIPATFQASNTRDPLRVAHAVIFFLDHGVLLDESMLLRLREMLKIAARARLRPIVVCSRVDMIPIPPDQQSWSEWFRGVSRSPPSFVAPPHVQAQLTQLERSLGGLVASNSILHMVSYVNDVHLRRNFEIERLAARILQRAMEVSVNFAFY